MSETTINDTTVKKRHRLSVKWKWALGSAVGVFLIFLAFSILLFKGMSGVLLQQERTHVNNTVDTVISRVDNLQGHFNSDSVSDALQPSLSQPSGSISDNANIYQNSLITDLSRDSTGVTVYNAKKRNCFQIA
ncbi:hypothetical protein [Secundilactobacillus odoratitofui]|uniref:hypothetical protein n=1 Tax=Secundilactobacillus odoratitofui TaxID=480930 RepID=UPI000B09216D|nr:hypothetical protein [Secundilactobacillus odoratitofui]